MSDDDKNGIEALRRKLDEKLRLGGGDQQSLQDTLNEILRSLADVEKAKADVERREADMERREAYMEEKQAIAAKQKEKDDMKHMLTHLARRAERLIDVCKFIGGGPRIECSLSQSRRSSSSDVPTPSNITSEKPDEAEPVDVEESRLPYGEGTAFENYVNLLKLPDDLLKMRMDLSESLQSVLEHNEELLARLLEAQVKPNVNGKSSSDALNPVNEHDKLSPSLVRPGKKSTASELKDTQPFVAKMLEAAYRILADLADHEDELSGLQFYAERGSTSKAMEKKMKLDRVPDFAFYTRDRTSETKVFDEFASTTGMVMSVEATLTLDNVNLKHALAQCEWDFVNVSGKYAAPAMRVGHSIVTNGLTWYFLQMWWEYRDGLWMRRIEISPAVRIVDNQGNADMDGVSSLSRWLAGTMKCAIKKECKPTGYAENLHEYSLVQVLGISRRALTSRWWSKGENKTIVIKVWETDDRKDKNEEYMEKEWQYLEEFIDCDWAIKGLNSEIPFILSDNMTCLKDEGDPLGSFDISGVQGKRLAKLVKECIWESALGELYKRDLSHRDIHEGNIIISPGLGKARLADFESVTAFGSDTSHSPTLLGQYYDSSKANTSKVATAEFDKTCTAALLHCMWCPLVTSFVTPIDGKSAELGRKDLLTMYADTERQNALIEEIGLWSPPE